MIRRQVVPEKSRKTGYPHNPDFTGRWREERRFSRTEPGAAQQAQRGNALMRLLRLALKIDAAFAKQGLRLTRVRQDVFAAHFVVRMFRSLPP